MMVAGQLDKVEVCEAEIGYILVRFGSLNQAGIGSGDNESVRSSGGVEPHISAGNSPIP